MVTYSFKFVKEYTRWDFTVWPLAALTGLSLRKFMSVSLLQNKVAVITRYCKAGFHCSMLCRALTCLVLCRLQSPSKVLRHFHLYLVHID